MASALTPISDRIERKRFDTELVVSQSVVGTHADNTLIPSKTLQFQTSFGSAVKTSSHSLLFKLEALFRYPFLNRYEIIEPSNQNTLSRAVALGADGPMSLGGRFLLGGYRESQPFANGLRTSFSFGGQTTLLVPVGSKTVLLRDHTQETPAAKSLDDLGYQTFYLSTELSLAANIVFSKVDVGIQASVGLADIWNKGLGDARIKHSFGFTWAVGLNIAIPLEHKKLDSSSQAKDTPEEIPSTQTVPESDITQEEATTKLLEFQRRAGELDKSISTYETLLRKRGPRLDLFDVDAKIKELTKITEDFNKEFTDYLSLIFEIMFEESANNSSLLFYRNPAIELIDSQKAGLKHLNDIFTELRDNKISEFESSIDGLNDSLRTRQLSPARQVQLLQKQITACKELDAFQKENAEILSREQIKRIFELAEKKCSENKPNEPKVTRSGVR